MNARLWASRVRGYLRASLGLEPDDGRMCWLDRDTGRWIEVELRSDGRAFDIVAAGRGKMPRRYR